MWGNMSFMLSLQYSHTDLSPRSTSYLEFDNSEPAFVSHIARTTMGQNYWTQCETPWDRLDWVDVCCIALKSWLFSCWIISLLWFLGMRTFRNTSQGFLKQKKTDSNSINQKITILLRLMSFIPNSKIHGANMGAHLGPTGPRWAPCGPREP